MLVLKHLPDKEVQEGEWFERVIWGATVGLKIRPRTEKAVQHIKDKFKGMKEGKKKAEAEADAFYDYFLEDFNGLADELPDGTVVPWEKTLENKKRLLFLEVPRGEMPNYDWAINKSNEMLFRIQEAELGN